MKKKIFFIIMTTLVINSISTSAYGVTGGISVNAIKKSQHGNTQEVDINNGNDIMSEENKKDDSIPNEFAEYTKFIGKDISILNVDTSQWDYDDFSHDLWDGSFYGHAGTVSVRLGWDKKTIVEFYLTLNDDNKISDSEMPELNNKLKKQFGENVEERNISYNFSGKDDFEFQLPKTLKQESICSVSWNFDNMVSFMDKKPQKETAPSSKETEIIVKKDPIIGMTTDEVRNSTWGNPSDINKTTTKYGVSEQWVYKFWDKHRYIYIEDGIVTTIQE